MKNLFKFLTIIVIFILSLSMLKRTKTFIRRGKKKKVA